MGSQGDHALILRRQDDVHGEARDDVVQERDGALGALEQGDRHDRVRKTRPRGRRLAVQRDRQSHPGATALQRAHDGGRELRAAIEHEDMQLIHHHGPVPGLADVGTSARITSAVTGFRRSETYCRAAARVWGAPRWSPSSPHR